MIGVESPDQDSWPLLLQVMLFQPIALDEQAKDLLKAGQYEQALNLAAICAADGAPWAETAFAETALLLLHGKPPPCSWCQPEEPFDIKHTPLGTQ